MIQRESWYLESATLAEERERLHNEFHRGLITAEEFARKIHILWMRERGESDAPFQFLQQYPDGSVHITKAWIAKNTELLREVGRSWGTLSQALRYQGGHRSEQEVVLRRGAASQHYDSLPVSERVLIVKRDRNPFGYQFGNFWASLPQPLSLMFFGPFHEMGREEMLEGEQAYKRVGNKRVIPTSDQDYEDWIRIVIRTMQGIARAAEEARPREQAEQP